MLAMIPFHTLSLLAIGLGILGFLLYRGMMRSGRGRRMFDTQERSSTTSDLIRDIERDADRLEARERSLAAERKRLTQELEDIDQYRNE